MVTIDYFSDILCVWAYGGQVRLEELQSAFGDKVLVRHRFMPLFADTRTRIGEGWKDDGGFEGFGRHMQEVCDQWPHTRLSPEAWIGCRPRSCVGPHSFLRAVSLALDLDEDGGDPDTRRLFEGLVTRVRAAFFEQGIDVSERDQLFSLLADGAVDASVVADMIDNGAAYAALHRDQELAKAYGVLGSPTYVFNEGRQLLYGNVGYRIIEANIRELLTAVPVEGAPSWC